MARLTSSSRTPSVSQRGDGVVGEKDGLNV